MAANFLYGLNILAYGHSIYQFCNNKDLTIKQRICGIVPRILGVAVDSSILGKADYRDSLSKLKQASLYINGVIFPLSDLVAKEDSYEDVFYSVLFNSLRLNADPETVMLINSLADKKQVIKNQCEETIVKIYNYYKLTIISLSNPEKIPERIQEEKTKFLKYLKTQKNQLGVIKETMQDYQNMINNAKAESFGSIPYFYMNKPEFKKRKCRISGELVREAVVVREISLPIYYECDNLSGWYKRERTIPPPSWPKSMPFSRDAIVVNKDETAQITKDLQKALDQTQNNPEELEAIKIGFLAVQEVLKNFLPNKTKD